MKKILLLIVVFVICSYQGNTSVLPTSSPITLRQVTLPTGALAYFSSLSMKEVQRFAGRKLKLKEKIAVKILQWKIKREINSGNKQVVKGKGHTAKILGIVALSALIVPVVGPLASLVCAILALVLGYSALKADPNDRQAKSGILMGWITIALFLLALILVVAILSSWTLGGWG